MNFKYCSGGVLNISSLDSVLSHVQNDDYYPEFIDKITHLFFTLCKFHPFLDGNKRTAIVATAYFLFINGYKNQVIDFIRQMENISVLVAANKIDKEILKSLIRLIIC